MHGARCAGALLRVRGTCYYSPDDRRLVELNGAALTAVPSAAAGAEPAQGRRLAGLSLTVLRRCDLQVSLSVSLRSSLSLKALLRRFALRTVR